MVRRDVLNIYKQLFKNVAKIEDADYRKYITDWVRGDFRSNKDLTDEVSCSFKISFLTLLDCNFKIISKAEY
jgi:hypothetical protein